MRLVGQVHVTLRGEAIHREPSFWEKIKQKLGGSLDLETDRVRVAFETSALVDSIKRALVRLGFDNAVSLVIDDTVVFQDADGKAGDLPDLMIAMSEHTSLFGSGFRELRLALEHEEAGLHLLVETRAFSEHPVGEPSAYVSVGGRIQELEPKPGESAEDYRQRVTPLATDSARLESARLQFESFVARLESALRAAMPEAIVEQKRADAVVVRPSDEREQEAPTSPSSPGYDPYGRYYPSPMGTMLDVLLISSFIHMLHPPMIHVVHPSGEHIGSAEDVAHNPDLATGDATGASDTSDTGDMGGDGDFGGGDDGDFGGGDFGGDDFGGFD
ncbi:hypothetical protein [Polyangium aurulentum]|uniref:hypothetical protein n=1 Tax=Polyangium aurulentum TaxID=2567896 RepID=UPI0010AE2311|nr:hypothetical protein [Polyangium aurulentum]UQA58107.1 hypothetical protein E8A73_043745 [Polyangium aurulentum]